MCHTLDESVQFFGSVFAVGAVTSLATGDLHIGQEALYEGILGDAQQGHVNARDNVADCKDARQRRYGTIQLIL